MGIPQKQLWNFQNAHFKKSSPQKMKKTSANQEHPNAGSRLNQGLKKNQICTTKNNFEDKTNTKGSSKYKIRIICLLPKKKKKPPFFFFQKKKKKKKKKKKS